MWQDSPARQAGVAVRSHAAPIAAAVVDRIYAERTDWGQDSYKDHHAKSVRDVEYHVRYLCEALWADDVHLFLSYVDWTTELFAGLGFSERVLPDTLRHLQDELHTRFTSPLIEAVDGFLIAAQARQCTPLHALPYIAAGQPFADLALDYLSLLLDARRHEAAKRVLDVVEQGARVEEIYLHVFQPVQQEIGRLWQTNRISVAQEHYATAATQFVMAQLYPYIFAAPRCGRRLVATSVGNELHELGVRMVADFFEMAGWDTYYLGANTPTPSVLRAVADYRADALGISATLTPHIAQVAELVGAARQLPSRPVILVGGYPFNLSPSLWQQVGADGTASDAQRAVRVAEQLLA